METPVKAGILYVQHLKFGKKSWRKVWAQLFANSPCGIARLETCEVRNDGSGPEKASLRRCERRVIRLADCVSVGPADAHSCPKGMAAFSLNTMEKSYMLAAEQRDGWIAQLSQLAFQCTKEPAPGSTRDPPGPDLHVEENTLYSSWQDLNEFLVLVHKTDASARCGLSGHYLLAALPKGLVLKTPQSRQSLLTWPYPFLRKFGHDKALFSFEAGRRCASRAGIFILATSRAAELCNLVSAAIARQSSSLLGRSSPQAPEPLGSRQGMEPRLRSSQSLEEALPPWALEGAGRPSLPAGLCPESGQALPCTLELGGCAGAGAETPIVYASIHRGLQPPLEPWGEAKVEQGVARAFCGQGLRVSEHLYENLYTLGRSCSVEGEGSSLLGSRGSPEGSSTNMAPIYDNSCMVSKRWSSPLAPSTGPSPSLEAQYRRLLDQEGQERGEEEEEGEEDALVSSLPQATVNSGFRKLVTLLSQEVAPKVPGKSSSSLDKA
ncbi:Docking protein 3 [Chelonia mydas]|uniref:Docking protein 3 n=1 Tax=Chelonia mydas TaxID=8469 RepID=M7AZG1_CHEMY|nr:Docking protein 3 [Chelonia mydas]